MLFLGQLLGVLSGLIVILAVLWNVRLGFQRHVAWGLGLLGTLAGVVLLHPALPTGNSLVYPFWISFAAIVWLTFLLVNWKAARLTPAWVLAGVVIAGMGGFCLIVSTEPADDPRVAFLRKYVRLLVDEVQRHLTGRAPVIHAITTPTTPTPFRSKLPPPTVPPGLPEPAPPGVFYLRDRVAVRTLSGVYSAFPGEEVTLVKALPGDRLLVRVGVSDVEVRRNQVTNDLGEARELEKRDFDARATGH